MAVAFILFSPANAKADTVITNTDPATLYNAMTNGGTITINASGTINLTKPIEITNSLTIDATTNTLVISGGGTMRVFNIHTNFTGTNITVTLRNLRVSAGSSTNGGGLYNGVGCTVVLISNLFTGNFATNAAGRTGSNGRNAGDNGDNGGSGGSAFGAAIYNIGTLVISNCSFTINSAAGGNAGNGGNGQPDFIFGGNGGNGGTGGTGFGGALYTSGNTAIYNSSFSQNHASSGNGGTAGAAGSGPFSGNPGNSGAGGGSAGGAIYATGSLGVTNCLFWENHVTGGASGTTNSTGGSGLGGAVYVSSAPTAEASFENSTFHQNYCEGGGNSLGGGGALATARISTLRNCTVATNDVYSNPNSTTNTPGSGSGGNIFCQSGSCTILNTILAKSSFSPNCAGIITDGGYNISSDNSPTFTVSTSHGNLNPMLTSLANNNGPTETLALLLGSPAIDKIPTNFTFLYPTNDQRGISRPQGTNVDIGAFEFMPLYTIAGRVRSGGLGVTNVTITITSPTNYDQITTNISGTTTNVTTNTITLNTNGVFVTGASGAFLFTNLPANTYLVFPPITNGITFSPSNRSVTVSGNQGVTNIYFELTSLISAQQYKDLHDFPTNTDARGPLLFNGSTLIGLTYRGGDSNLGSVFSYSTNGTVNNLHIFNGTQGANPVGIITGTDNNYYGATYSGGSNNLGTVFKLLTNGGAYTVIVSFTGDNGAHPYAGVIQAANSDLYGTTSAGGTFNQGTVFKTTTTGTLTSLYSFTGSGDGGTPLASLTAGTNGTFYGTTFAGGAGGSGTIFNISSNGALTTLHSFTGTADGSGPAAPLLLGRDGFYYGTTTSGGASNAGTIFRITPDGTFTSLIHITDINASLTNAPLLQGLDGDFYATSNSGGDNNLGFSFRFSGSTIISHFSFTGTNGTVLGSHPYSGVVQNTNGVFYGIAANGGTSDGGVIFQVGVSPFIISSPTNVVLSPTNLTHSAAIFSITTEGSTPLKYQWVKNSTNLVKSAHLVGATNATLTVTNIVATDVGTYTCIVSNSYGLAESSGAELIIGYPPKVTVQPVSLLRQPVGGDVNYRVTATGAPTLNYQWFFNATNLLVDDGRISGANTTNLTVSRITAADVGSYYVQVSNGFGVSNSTGAALTLIGDVTKPTILISSPTANIRTDYPFLLGTASDNVRIASVNFWVTNIHNGTNVISGQAMLDNGVKTRSWIVFTNLNAGTNILAVQAVDFTGLTSAIVSRSFFYKVPSPISLPKIGTGQGHFTGTASITGDPVPGDGALLNIGERYTVTAVSETNSFFTNWSGPFGISTNPTINFVMEPGTTFTANFVTNLFIGMAGTYNGLFFQTTTNNDLAAATLETSGFISTFKTTGKGAYSGRMVMGGASYTLAGNFNKEGVATNIVARAAAAGGRMIVLLTNMWNDRPRQILGTVTATNLGSWTSRVALVTAPTNAGGSLEYTMIIPSTNMPKGSGYALITNKTDNLTLTVKLPDATAAFSQAVPLSEAKFAPLYQSLYGNAGFIMGWLDFDGSTLGENIPVGNLIWLKKSTKVSLLYTNGFTNYPVLKGSIWINPGRTNVLPFTNGSPGTLEISGGDLLTGLTNMVLLSTNNVLTKSSGPTNSLAGTIDPKTGLINITFGNGNGKATTIGQGAVLQSSKTGAGAFLGKTNSGAISLHP